MELTLLVIYLLPWMIASMRSHPNSMSIAIINICLGWTGLGWIVCLAWAASATKKG